MKLIRNIFVAILALMFWACLTEDTKIVRIYIPMDYTGWVNIVFNESGRIDSKLNEEYTYKILSNPNRYFVNSLIFPSGKYNMFYYYYDEHDTVNLDWNTYPNKNVFFEGVMGGNSNFESFTFYVSKKAMNVDSISIDMLPVNDIVSVFNNVAP